ncbi:MAG TPA: TIGR02281 family clan AA aspartic protease [Gammaproteobacteria bacterium]|jgi:aspartyl protease family protein
MNEQHNPATRPAPLGRAMLLGGWLLGLLLLAYLFNGLLEQQRNPNRSIQTVTSGSGLREVVLQRNRHGHYLASGSINSEAVEFLLDTGASDVSIPESVARRLGLQRGAPIVYATANGPITAYHTRLSSLALGGIELHEVRASINPHMDGDTILLGMSFLKHLEFTQRGDTLIIRQYP